jgi:hypothetical protein
VLAAIVNLLATKQRGWRYWLFEELRIITGQDFGLNPLIPAEDQDEVVDRARAWVEAEGKRFEAGAVYKYGHKQDIQNIF